MSEAGISHVCRHVLCSPHIIAIDVVSGGAMVGPKGRGWPCPLARRVEGDDHKAAHDVGAGEPLVGQWWDS